MPVPRIILSAISGGAGKTMVSLGLARAFHQQGLRVKTFKKGPDYIDSAWLSLAAKTEQGNLDLFFSSAASVRDLFAKGSKGYDFALIEGNRGLFDGLDLSGSCSTATLAQTLAAPVILVLDCTKMTRTAAAVVAGCANFEQNVTIDGVILNRTGNPRHQEILTQAVETLAGVPVLGAIPRQAMPFIAERHMGLVHSAEQEQAEACLDALAECIRTHVDLNRVLAIATKAEPFPALPTVNTWDKKPDTLELAHSSGPTPVFSRQTSCSAKHKKATPLRQGAPLQQAPVIGVVKDQAFWFYYQENLTALEAQGARLVPVSLLSSTSWPELNGLYIGGGLPEQYAAQLTANEKAKEKVHSMAMAGIPIYAECGGFMYLTSSLLVNKVTYPMAGVFPVALEMCPRPQGLGYVEAEVVAANPYYAVGSSIKGHEFHFSRPMALPDAPPILRLHKGKGMGAYPLPGALAPGLFQGDALICNNTFASYTHIYAPALPQWAANFVQLCATRNA